MHCKYGRLYKKHNIFTLYRSNQVHRNFILACGLQDGITVSHMLHCTLHSFLQFIKQPCLPKGVMELDMHKI